MKERINELCDDIHTQNVVKGFYDKPREIGTELMLVVSELSEALEAERKNKHANLDLYYKNVKGGIPIWSAFETNIKDTFEDEIADAVIRLFDMCGHYHINLEKHIEEKLNYNKDREYRHGKKF